MENENEEVRSINEGKIEEELTPKNK